jgi:hypothetical protein
MSCKTNDCIYRNNAHILDKPLFAHHRPSMSRSNGDEIWKCQCTRAVWPTPGTPELHLCGAQAEKFQFPNEMLANKPNPNLVLECLLIKQLFENKGGTPPRAFNAACGLLLQQRSLCQKGLIFDLQHDGRKVYAHRCAF